MDGHVGGCAWSSVSGFKSLGLKEPVTSQQCQISVDSRIHPEIWGYSPCTAIPMLSLPAYALVNTYRKEVTT